MRLINADHLDTLILAIERGNDRSFIARTLKGIINAAPTVEAIPVEWIKQYGEQNWFDYGTPYNAITCMLKAWEERKG